MKLAHISMRFNSAYTRNSTLRYGVEGEFSARVSKFTTRANNIDTRAGIPSAKLRISTLRNAAEGEFPARVPSLQPEPKARDATAQEQDHLPPSCVQYFSALQILQQGQLS